MSDPKVSQGLPGWIKAAFAGMGCIAFAALLLFGGLYLLMRSSLARGESGLTHRGQDVSTVAYVDASGTKHTLAEEKGKIIIVDVWATWCPPCRKSLPGLAKLAAEGGNDYTVIPISVDDDGFKAVTPFLQSHPELAALPGLIPDGRSGLKPLGDVSAIPSTFLVDRQGMVLDAWAGVQEERLTTGLKKALHP